MHKVKMCLFILRVVITLIVIWVHFYLFVFHRLHLSIHCVCWSGFSRDWAQTVQPSSQ